MKSLTLELFQECTGAPRDRAELFYEPTIDAMGRFAVIDESMAMFLAHVAIESNRLTQVEESLYYKDPERVARIYLRIFDKDHNRQITPEEAKAAEPYCRNHAALSKLLYNGYHGRGLIQLTWEKNYRAASEALGYDYVGNPDLLKEPMHAALSACWFYVEHGCLALANDIQGCTAKINPALMHLAERKAQWQLNAVLLA